jgi:hypothetical protein
LFDLITFTPPLLDKSLNDMGDVITQLALRDEVGIRGVVQRTHQVVPHVRSEEAMKFGLGQSRLHVEECDSISESHTVLGWEDVAGGVG